MTSASAAVQDAWEQAPSSQLTISGACAGAGVQDAWESLLHT